MTQNITTKVFISYSHRDIEFVQRLHRSLREYNQSTWIDWQNISSVSDWWQEIKHGIKAATFFIFIISSQSVNSKICWNEIEQAAKLRKCIIPIIWQKDFDLQILHPALLRYNWLFFRDEDKFDDVFQLLLQRLNNAPDKIIRKCQN